MSFVLCHASGNMFDDTDAREHAYKVAANNGDIFTTTEAQQDHAAIEKIAGFDTVAVTELAIGWKPDRFTKIDSGHRLVMNGGNRGDGQHKADKRRRGPDRYLLWVALRETATGQLWLICLHHAIAKADTSFLWRRFLRSQGFKNAAAEVKAARAKHPGAQTVLVGDWNTKGKVNFGLGLTEVKTPGTMGKARYDRVQTDPDVRASGVKTLTTGLDHEALIVRLSVMGAPPPKPPKPPEVTMPRTAAQAIAHCRTQSAHGPKFGANECKIQCRSAYLVPSDGSATASIAFGRTKFKHPIPADLSQIPDGALLWWTGGTPTKNHPEGAGHVAIKDGALTCESTDFKRTGFFDLVAILGIAKKWTRLKLVGWSEDIDGKRVIKATGGVPQLPKPAVNKMNPKAYFLGAIGTHVTWLGTRLVAHGFGRFYKAGPGPTFTATDRNAVAAFQRAQGWTGPDADGLPGKETLKRLAAAVPGKPPTPPKPPTATGKVVDYSFARPSPAALKAAGFKVAVRYIARSSKKVLTKTEAAALHKAGLGILLIWETTAKRAGEGAAAGTADAKAAEAAADKLGYPKDVPIFYAVDFDATATQVKPYMNAVKKAAKRPVGVYGGFKIADAGLAPYVWQTEAWSHGQVSTKAHMLQRIHPTLKVKGAKDGWDENDLRHPIPTWRP